MADFMCILGRRDPDIDITPLRQLLEEKEIPGKLEILHGEDDTDWTELDVYNGSGEYMINLVRCAVTDDSQGRSILAALKPLLADSKPASGAAWISQFFDGVSVVYLFHMYCFMRIYPPEYSIEDNLIDNELVYTVFDYILKQVNGIVQTDEGYENEDGDTILWTRQTPVYATSKNCALMDPEGQWQRFVVQLSDEDELQQFLNGQRPANSRDCDSLG